MIYGGEENFSNMLRYLLKEVFGAETEAKPPKRYPGTALSPGCGGNVLKYPGLPELVRAPPEG